MDLTICRCKEIMRVQMHKKPITLITIFGPSSLFLKKLLTQEINHLLICYSATNCSFRCTFPQNDSEKKRQADFSKISSTILFFFQWYWRIHIKVLLLENFHGFEPIKKVLKRHFRLFPAFCQRNGLCCFMY